MRDKPETGGGADPYSAGRSPPRRWEPSRHALLVALVAATAVPLALRSPAAEPGETLIDATFTWTSRDLSKVVDADGTETFVSENFVVLTHERSPKETRPFPDLGGRCVGSGTSDPMTFGYTLSGVCELKDADGDTLFERFEERSAGNEGRPTFLIKRTLQRSILLF